MSFTFYCFCSCTVFLAFCPFFGQCQDDRPETLIDYEVRHFTTENGLPQNSVKAILAGEWGNIWLVTERGLVRFNGQQFSVFENFGSPHASRSFGVIVKGRGLFAINHGDDYFYVEEGQALRDIGYYSKFVGLPPYSRSRPQSIYITEGLPSVNEKHVNPAIFIVPIGGETYYAYNNKFIDFYVGHSRSRSALIGQKKIWLFFRLGASLYLQDGGHLARINGNDADYIETTKLSGDLLLNRLYHPNTNFKVLWNNYANQAFILLGKSLYALYDEGRTLRTKLVVDGFDFESNGIISVYHDVKAGRVFLGSHTKGLFVLTKKIFKPNASRFPGTDNVYYGQFGLDATRVLTGQGIVYAQDTVKNQIEASQLQQITKAVDWDKTSILVDRHKRIWCKQRLDLYCFEPGGKKLRGRWYIPGEMTQLYEGIDGRIWVGTRSAGLFYIDPGAKNPVPELFFSNGVKKITWIQQQSPDILWVATHGRLWKILLKKRKILRIKSPDNLYIRSLYISPDSDQIWITTYKDGFFLLTGNRLTRFPLDKRGYLASPHCIVEDQKGFFWITTNNGLFQVPKRDLLDYVKAPKPIYYFYYSKVDGFNTNEFNGGCQPCAVRLPSGYVSLPSMNGLVWFRPEQVVPDLPDKPIFFENIQINGKNQPVFGNRLIFRQDQKQLSIAVSTAYFGNSDNVEFSYAFVDSAEDPEDSDWLPIDSKTGTIGISQLTKGEYTLHIRKKSGFGRNNYDYNRLTVIVPPLWYQTWWSYLFGGVAALVLFFLFVTFRFRAIQKRNTLLQKQVDLRTEQLEESRNDLLMQLHLQSRLMASIAHDIRTPLGAALIVAEKVRKLIDTHQIKEASFYGKNMEDAIRRVKHSLENLLAYVKIQVYKREVKKERVYLYELIEKNYQLYGKNDNVNLNRFINDIPQAASAVTNRQLLDIIVHNLIDNANKFTYAGTIRASLEKKFDEIRLTIEDSGKGISPEIIKWFEYADSSPVQGTNGIGLTIIKELAPLVAREIRIKRLEQGTRFSIIFPTDTGDKQKHLSREVDARESSFPIQEYL